MKKTIQRKKAAARIGLPSTARSRVVLPVKRFRGESY